MELAGAELTHPNRILYHEPQVTQQDLAEYYARVAEWIFPHLDNRFLTLVRCPDGQQEGCFYQRHVPGGPNRHLQAVSIRERRGTAEYFKLRKAEGLLSLVQMGALEIHAWNARADRPERPDQLIFDLDPGPGVAWPRVIAAAFEVRELLSDLGLTSYPKATGGKGLHVIAPLVRRTGWGTTKAFAKAVARRMCHRDPDGYVFSAAKDERRHRIFIDYLRNGRGATCISPFSTRALPGAPLAMPISWEQLRSLPAADHFTLETARRLELSNAWEGYFDVNQSLTQEMLRAFDLNPV